MTAPRRVVIAGIGNEYRSDDGVGVEVARRLSDAVPGVTDIGPAGEPLDLLGRWDGADLAVVVDATRSGAPPGTVRLIELAGAEVAAASPSTHGLGILDVLRLARAVGAAPRRVVVVGVEGDRFGPGLGLCRAVEEAVAAAVAAVVALVEERR